MDDTTTSGPITFERVIDASPDEAFALFTQPERLRRWQAISAAIDLRVGGDYRLTITPGNIASGRFTEVEAGRRLIYTWGWDGSDDLPPGASTVVVDFEPAGDRTRVRVTHAGLSPEQGAGHAEGWSHYLERLDDAASAGDAGPDPWAAAGDDLDELSAAEASWAICRNVLHAVTADDQDLPTPCSEYTAHDLVEHLMRSLRGLGGMAGAEIPEKVEATSAEDYIAQAAELALAAWRARGLAGEVAFGRNPVPASMPAGILSLEFFVHAWDLAHATGQPFVSTEPLTAFVTGIAEQVITPQGRGEGKAFADSVAATHDDPVARLMAFTGRAV
jgi:uncharacterized protein (TIGR03086 family)